MTNKEAIEVLDDMKVKITIPKSAVTQNKRNEALDLAITALKVLDDVNNKVYRNENCDRAGKCIDYIGWHCAGCNGAKEVMKNE